MVSCMIFSVISLCKQCQCRPFRLVKKRTSFRRCLICEKSEYFCIFYNILQKKILYRIHWEKTSKGIIVVLDLLIDTEEGSWVSCTANLGYPVGTILSGLLMDSIGRKTTALVFQVFMTPWVLITRAYEKQTVQPKLVYKISLSFHDRYTYTWTFT